MSQDSGKDHLDHLFGSDSERSAEEQEYESIEKDEHPMVEERTSEQSSISEDEKVARPNRKRTLADVKIKEMAIKKLSAPDVDNRMPILLKLPGFMGIQNIAYSSRMVLEEELAGVEGAPEEDANNAASLLHAASSIRWRNGPKSEGGKASNARMVKWSDGSWSLMVGEELFDISRQSMTTEHNYIFGRHAEEGSMECLGRLRERIMIRPYITDDQRHRKYLAAAAVASAKASADVRVKMAVTVADPEMEKQRMIKLEQEKIKAKRKLEAKRRTLKQRSYERVGRTGLTAKFLEERDEEDIEEEDEYEKDFIDDTNMSEREESESVTSESESEAEFSGKEEEQEGSEEVVEDESEGEETIEEPKPKRRIAIVDDEDEDEDE